MKTNIILPSEIVGEKTNTQKIVILIVFMLISLALIFYAHTSDYDSKSTINMLIGSCGYIGLLSVCFALFTKKKHAIYTPTGSRIVYRTIEFSANDYELVQSIVKDRETAKLSSIIKKDGISMYMDIVYSQDRQFAAYQFFKYIPYEYTSASEVCFVEKCEVEKFCL